MEISANLLQEIKRGNVVLFLGAGASMEAIDNASNGMLGVQKLIDKLSDEYLGGEEKKSSLATVAELAQSESDRISVQIFIKKLFEQYRPTDFHLKIPLFRWKSIYTTNYDLLIEKSYEHCGDSPQKLVPIYASRDRVEQLIRTPNDLPYVKLHGCINKIDEYDPPLILTTDQYISHRKGRETLFERLKSLGSSHTILFVGHSLEDSDIRLILQEVNEITSDRPRYYALVLDHSLMTGRLWEGRRVSLMKGTFRKFLDMLEQRVTNVERKFVSTHDDHLIERHFVKADYKLTEDTLKVLTSSLELVHSAIPSEKTKPQLFYHGYSKGWSPIEEDLDIPRTISDEVISQVMLSDESERQTNTELFLLSGSAGSGKSVALKRVAWDSAIDYNKICLFWSSNERISYNSIIEIAEKVGERIFVFVDKAVSHVPDLMLLISKLKEAKAKVTLLIAERSNEWNIECSSLHKFVTESFDIRYLGKREIGALVDKLDKHNCLGVLKGKTREEQISAFHDTAGRQLLVALHEATSAKTFAEIIHDEYDNIVPQKAKLIYRTICVMNRLNVPVRAGIINRVHGVSFKEFGESFFLPLENVVNVTNYTAAYDNAYEARHPMIAEMVYTHALKSEQDRFDNLISIMSVLDIGYSADRLAFREFIKYKELANIFTDLDRVEQIYERAYSICGDDDYYYQQKAIFYMRASKKRYVIAEELLHLAQRFGPYNTTIKHTLAELELTRAANSSGLERERHYNKANTLAYHYTGSQSNSSHGYDTILKVSISRLEDAIKLDDEELITESTRGAEKSLREALQKFPDDEKLLTNEMRLAQLLSDSDRAFIALKKAFAKNSANSYLATSLSIILIQRNEIDEAKQVLVKVLESTPGDKAAHGKLGMIFAEHNPDDNANALHHFKRSFTQGDSNHINQLWYARQLYLSNEYDEYTLIILKLKSINMSPYSKHRVRGLVRDNNGKNTILVGKITRKEHSYAVAETPGYKGVHFLHKSNIPDSKFENLNMGESISYNLGFTFAGAAAVYCED